MAEAAYAFARHLPSEERFGMKTQMERAAISVALNIGEGLGRGTDGDLERSLRIAAGSAAEVEVVIRLASRLHGLSGEASTVRREVTAIRHSLFRFIEVVHKRRTR